MDFTLSDDHKMIRDSTREFAQQVLKPGVIQRDSNGSYPAEEVHAMAELGFFGILVDAEYGGSGLDYISYALIMEELSKVDNSCSVIISAHNSLVCWGIQGYANEELKKAYLPRLAAGEYIGAFCLSEPGAGSDATNQKTTAVDRGDHYLLNGTKNWITNGKKASVYVVIAQTDVTAGHRGINAFVVDANTKGVSTGIKEDKLGIRSSDTCTVMFQDVVVPKMNRLGPEGFGFKYALKTLDGGRIGIAAQALGIASGSYELARSYAAERQTFGKPINQHQAIAFKLADMATRIECGRMLLHRAAWMKDQDLDINRVAAMAKLYCSEAAMEIATEAVQIHGGYGFVKEYHVERLMRDAKITQIYEGTSEIQRLVISRSLNLGDPYLPV